MAGGSRGKTSALLLELDISSCSPWLTCPEDHGEEDLGGELGRHRQGEGEHGQAEGQGQGGRHVPARATVQGLQGGGGRGGDGGGGGSGGGSRKVLMLEGGGGGRPTSGQAGAGREATRG